MKTVQQVNADMDAMIARYGWAVQGVGSAPASPGFCYTVGLAAKGLPEIIMFGLPMSVAHEFLNRLALRCTRDGVPPLDTDLHDVADNYPARLLPVPRSQADQYLLAAKRRYPDYTAVQLVWCDANGRFPWDAGFNPALAAQQPILRGQLH